MYGQQPPPGYGPPPPQYPMQPQMQAPPFRCNACGFMGNAMIIQKTTTGGWILFWVLLFMCLPLCWLGLLMKERRTQCPSCRVMVG